MSAQNSIYSFFSKSNNPNVSASEFYANNLPANVIKSKPQSDKGNEIVATDANLKAEISGLKTKVVDLETQNKALSTQNKKLRDDLTALKKLYNATCQNYVQKDLKIKLLAKKNLSTTPLYDDFKHSLGPDTLKVLRQLNSSKRKDSTFILTCMKKLCGNDDNLRNIRACGRMENSILSPDKRKIIDGIFIERLSNETTENAEFNERYMRLNSLINSAVNNMLRVSAIEFTKKHQYQIH